MISEVFAAEGKLALLTSLHGVVVAHVAFRRSMVRTRPVSSASEWAALGPGVDLLRCVLPDDRGAT